MAFLTIPLASTVAAPTTATWTLQITNLSSTTLNLTNQDILALPKTTVTADLACYGNPVASGDWGGAKLSDILNKVGIDPSVTSVDFKASDGYSVSIPLDMAMRSDVILAYNLSGSPLAEGLRLVIPGANGNMWISMITSIKMNTTTLTQATSSKSNVSPSEPYQPTTNTTTPPFQPQPTQTPTPALTSKPTVEPTVPPANATQLTSAQQVSGSVVSGLSLENVVWVLIGAAVIVAGGFAVYSRKKLKA
ncbi:MAG TPA: molybdopterin-dependent oxidoreductase [Candidatus Binatia bacterium]|nr:molybdopterin-dependent oxidoreductase [Candidatus Binatia bacterium]